MIPGSSYRKSIRLKGRDYAAPDAYFLAICAHERRCIFGQIVEANFVPSDLGRIVRACLVAIPHHFPQVTLEEFIIMPNHVHGLIAITPPPLVGAQHSCALPAGSMGIGVKAESLGAIVRSFKAIAAKRAHKELRWKGPIWQRNYYERVLLDGQEFSHVSRYIAENPMKWEWDRENPRWKRP